MRSVFQVLFVLAAAVLVGTAGAADHAIPAGKIANAKYDIVKGDKSTVRITPAPLDTVDVGDPGRFIFTGKPGTTYHVKGYVVNFKTQKFFEVDDTYTFGDKTPDPIKPDPITSFHVLIVYESMKTYPAKVTGVLNSGDIRAYLDAVTTPDEGTKGWRLRDKDLSADNDTAFQKALWDDVKPKITKVPCWVVEVNKQAEIIEFPATVAEGLATLRKYKGEK